MTALTILLAVGVWFALALVLAVFVLGPMLARNERDYLDLTDGE